VAKDKLEDKQGEIKGIKWLLDDIEYLINKYKSNAVQE